MIKTKQIKTAKATILVIGGLPEYANRFKFFNDEEPYLSYFVGSETFREYNIPPGKWELVGFLDKITKGVAKELVGTVSLMGEERYNNYHLVFGGMHGEWFARAFTKATESLRSLVAANCELENQYGEFSPELNPICCNIPVYDRNGLPECCGVPVPSEESVYLQQMWQAEEEKLFRNPYLLKKID